MKKTVPVDIYEEGVRKVVGDAVVDHSSGVVVVDANIFSAKAPSIFAGLESVTLKARESEGGR